MKFSGERIRKYVVAISPCLLIFASTTWAADDKSDIAKRLDNSANVLNEIMSAPDNGIPDNVLGDAKCIAVVPSMLKIGLGIGGNHGKGVATCRTKSGWSAPAPITVAGGSWGLQIGGEAVDLVMLIMNEKGMQNLLSSKFKVGADASAAAGPVGRQAAADTDWKMKSEVLTYSRARGVFAGIDLSGSRIAQDNDETRILYGKMETFSDILNGKVEAPSGSQPFLSAVKKYTSPSQQGSVVAPPAPAASTTQTTQ